MAGMSGSSMARSSATLAVPFGRPLGLPDMPDWNRMSPSIPVIFLFYQDTWTASAEDAAERTSVRRTRGVYKGRPITLEHAKITATAQNLRRLAKLLYRAPGSAAACPA
jgi:hypothetical protein